MQRHIRYLVVEDDPAWSQALSAEIRSYFEQVQGFRNDRICDDSAYDGDQGLRRLSQAETKYDLVTLDMNLGAGASKSKINGLDLLGRLGETDRAFFVLLITGAFNDPSLDALYEPHVARLMRYGLQNESVKRLSHQRVGYLPKPALSDVGAAVAELRPFLHEQLQRYCDESRERNIFRPDPASADKWEVRFDGGPRRSVNDSAPFQLIRMALAHPNEELDVIKVMHAIAGKTAAAPDHGGELDPETLDQLGFSLTQELPADMKEGVVTPEVLIRVLLECVHNGNAVEDAMAACRRQMGLTRRTFSGLRSTIRRYAADRRAAEDEFPGRSALLPKALRQLDTALAELASNPETSDEESAGDVKRVRVALGKDSDELVLARKHFPRALKYLRRDKQLGEFVRHLESCVKRGQSSQYKCKIRYEPPDTPGFIRSWLTE